MEILREKLSRACALAGREPGSVRLIGVGKTFPAEMIGAAVNAGVTDIGENYIQESIAKQSQLSDMTAVWHFIGHLQKNKAKEAARHFDWIHTVDSVQLARRLSAARAGMPPLNICLQINIDRENSKSGLASEEAADVAQEIAGLANLRLRGLMAIPRLRDTNRRAPFRALSQLQQTVSSALSRQGGEQLDVLSIGMSDDFVEAIAEGATHIRIGRAIFGDRVKKEEAGKQ